MKHIFKLTPIFAVLLALLSSISSAASDETVKLTVGGHPLSLRTAARLHAGTVYVPLETLAEVGAKIDIDARHRRDGQSVRVFPAVEKEFTCHAKLLDGELMLPIWDIAQKLGVAVDWNEPARTLRMLAQVDRLEFDGSSIRAATSFPVNYDVIWWKSARKLIVDLHGVQLPEKLPDALVKNTTGVVMRTGMLNDGETGRIVLEMPNAVRFSKATAIKTSYVTVSVYGLQPTTTGPRVLVTTPEPPTKPDVKTPTVPPVDSTASITGVECRNVDHRHIEVRVTANAHINYTTSMLHGPDRLVVDFPKATLEHKIPDMQVNHGALKGIRIAQCDPATVRLTLDVTRFILFDIQQNAPSGGAVINLQLPKGAGGTLAKKVVVIDPGHGGRETGAIGCCGTMEKDINLSIAKRVKKLLADADVCAVLTRDTDAELVVSSIKLDLEQRVDFAARHAADIFVSIHCNSCTVPNSLSGTEIYYHGQEQSSKELARCIQSEVCDATGQRNRGVKSDISDLGYSSGLSVLRNSTNKYHMPAVLLETGFINNANEESKLCDPAFQEKIAQAIVKGLKEYVEGN